MAKREDLLRGREVDALDDRITLLRETNATLEAIAHPTKRVAYAGMPTTRLDWLPDGALVQTRQPLTVNRYPRSINSAPYFVDLVLQQLRAKHLDGKLRSSEVRGVMELFDSAEDESADEASVISQLAHQLLLTRGQLGGRLDEQLDHQVAAWSAGLLAAPPVFRILPQALAAIRLNIGKLGLSGRTTVLSRDALNPGPPPAGPTTPRP